MPITDWEKSQDLPTLIEVVKLAKELRHAGVGRKPKSGVLSLRGIAAELAAAGHVNERSQPYNPKSIAAMLSA